jgi:hypothetical protein
MTRRDLLPGVSPDVPALPVVFASARVVRRARRVAMLRDVLDLTLLTAVDTLFLRWPSARVPMLDRHQSLLLLVAVNLALLTYLWASRKMPQWSARRVAATWSDAERQRLTAALRPRAMR